MTIFKINNMKTTNKVSRDSTIGKILLGKTRGFYDWYVKYILDNKSLFEIID